MMRVLVALGGNALQKRGEPMTVANQRANVAVACAANVGSAAAPLNLRAWSGPASNDDMTVDFRQLVNANDALRTGTYNKALTFTLSTTTP